MPSLYRSRPGASEIKPASAEHATEVGPDIWVSPGLSNAYLIRTPAGRVIVNTGMGFEAGVHRANFDAVDSGPIRWIVLTQGHYDHVGGVDTFREPATQVVAHSSFGIWRDDNERLEAFRSRNAAFAWLEAILAALDHAKRRSAGDLPAQSRPEPTTTFADTLHFICGGRAFDLFSTPGGETTDSIVVWLPQDRICLCGNVFGALFGHIPNLVTMRGDRYRDALQVAASIERVRQLEPECLLTGHFAPIRGRELIQRELVRLRDAVLFLHDETVKGMNKGRDVHTLMRTIELPPELDVGQGYGKVAWNVRAIWENYAGWFHHRATTELYAEPPAAACADLVELAGAEALVTRARDHLEAGETLKALHLTEIVLSVENTHVGARAVALGAHEALLAASVNFWETAWLRRQIDRLRA